MQIINCKQLQSSICVYYTQLKSLWDEYDSYVILPTCDCGAMRQVKEIHEQQRLLEFLMELNESYSAIHSQILLMEPTPSIPRAYSLLVQEERQREVHVSLPSESISAAAIQRQNNDRDLNVKFKGKPRMQCEHCGRMGHTKARCYHIHGFPKRSVSNSQSQQPKDRHLKRMIGRGKLENGLYVLEIEKPAAAHVMSDSSLWHYRLGHPSFSRLKNLFSFS
ncbi:uncharacterized protein LOC116266877 [Nymphaea colorata]|uniref:uncharacterized protein LOC116266877 n=1 Tax=Nymphaea colorata TaxID=210225 RepID=UPI00129E8620|nr:uncharacterized protein LOC116266877 [Nymphaea colorata]